MEAQRRAVFLDLNGTLVMPVQPSRLDQLEQLPGIADAISRLNRAGFVCPVVTVQSRIAKGMFSISEFESWFGTLAVGLATDGAEIVGPYVCPHLFSVPCACEKPKTLLYERAAVEHEIDIKNSWVVGDTAPDVQAAITLNARPCLVRTGWGEHEENIRSATSVGAPIASSLTDAVELILE